MRALAIVAMVVGVLLLGVGGVGALGYLRPESRLPAAYASLPEGSPSRKEALQALRRSSAAQAYLAGMGGGILLLLGMNLWVLVGVRERMEASEVN